jgi:hypothetical protein
VGGWGGWGGVPWSAVTSGRRAQAAGCTSLHRALQLTGW